jgi:hypothetical protein
VWKVRSIAKSLLQTPGPREGLPTKFGGNSFTRPPRSHDGAKQTQFNIQQSGLCEEEVTFHKRLPKLVTYVRNRFDRHHFYSHGIETDRQLATHLAAESRLGRSIWRPFRARRSWWTFPGLKPWAEFCSPCGAQNKGLNPRTVAYSRIPFSFTVFTVHRHECAVY